MERISFGVFIAILILFVENETVNGKSCLSSMPTLRRVEECPKTQEDWNEASAKKRCDMLAGTQQCASFVYHCLLNQWGNVTVEVCAPTWFLSGFCAMYNTDESRVIDNFNLDCNNNTKIKKEDRCPSRYISTDTYKYQICYKKREIHSANSERMNQLNIQNENISGLTIVFIVLFIVALAASVFQAVLLYRVGCDKIRKNRNTDPNQSGGDDVPPGAVPDIEASQGNTDPNQSGGDDVPPGAVPDIEASQGNSYQNQHGRDHDSHEKDPLLEDNQDFTLLDAGKNKKDGVSQIPYNQGEKKSKHNPQAGNAQEKEKNARKEEQKGVAEQGNVKKVLEQLGEKPWPHPRNRPTAFSANDDRNKKNTFSNTSGMKDKGLSSMKHNSSDNDIHGSVEQSVEDKLVVSEVPGGGYKEAQSKPIKTQIYPNEDSTDNMSNNPNVFKETDEKTNASTQMQQEEVNKGTEAKDGKDKTETDEKTNASAQMQQEEVNKGTKTKDDEDKKETDEKPNASVQMQQEEVNKGTETKDDEDKKESTGVNLDKPRDEKSTYPEKGHVKRQTEEYNAKVNNVNNI